MPYENARKIAKASTVRVPGSTEKNSQFLMAFHSHLFWHLFASITPLLAVYLIQLTKEKMLKCRFTWTILFFPVRALKLLMRHLNLSQSLFQSLDMR